MTPIQSDRAVPRLAAVLGAGSGRIWGMTGAERLERQYHRAGLQTVSRAVAEAADHGDILLTLGDWVYDEALIKALATRRNAVLVSADGEPVAANVSAGQVGAVAHALEAGRMPEGLERLDAAELAYNHALRKREPPVLTRLTPQTVRAVEARLFQGSYKGVTDLVTKHVWPVPARIVTRWCALVGLRPNHVTFASFLFVLAAFWLFWTGHFGWGLVCAWIMTFLDTVDGKLARVTLTSSPMGEVFDHGIDLIHPPFWWWAWFVGVQTTTPHLTPMASLVMIVVIGGYVAQRVEEGIFLKLFKVEMHAWRPFDSFFRQITARRNPNLILLTLSVFAGRPDIGLAAVAVWTAVCFAVHALQIVQALATPREKIVSWLAK